MIKMGLSLTSDTKVNPTIKQGQIEGIEFFRLSDVSDNIGTRRQLYSLVKSGVIDDPGQNGTFETFEQFSEKIFQPFYWKNRDSQFLASLQGDWIGLCSVTIDQENLTAKCGLTAVIESHRGSGIATQLKAQSIQYCEMLGIKRLTTSVSELNYPMIAINRNFGFTKM